MKTTNTAAHGGLEPVQITIVSAEIMPRPEGNRIFARYTVDGDERRYHGPVLMSLDGDYCDHGVNPDGGINYEELTVLIEREISPLTPWETAVIEAGAPPTLAGRNFIFAAKTARLRPSKRKSKATTNAGRMMMIRTARTLGLSNSGGGSNA